MSSIMLGSEDWWTLYLKKFFKRIFIKKQLKLLIIRAFCGCVQFFINYHETLVRVSKRIGSFGIGPKVSTFLFSCLFSQLPSSITLTQNWASFALNFPFLFLLSSAHLIGSKVPLIYGTLFKYMQSRYSIFVKTKNSNSGLLLMYWSSLSE